MNQTDHTEQPNKYLLLAIYYLRSTELYVELAIIVIGLLGNAISSLVFVGTKLRHNPANMILAMLALADNCFLVSLLIVMVKYLNVHWFDNVQLVCKLVVYVTSVSSFLSTWLIVIFSMQRLLVVYFPLRRYEFCSRGRTQLAVVCLTLVCLTLECYTFVVSGLESNRKRSACVTLSNWMIVAKKLMLVDTLLSIVVPFLIITSANVLIAVKLMRTPTLQQLHAGDSARNSSEFGMLVSDRQGLRNDDIFKRTSALVAKRTAYSDTNRTLLIISTTFLVLNSPMAISKIYYFVSTFFGQYDKEAGGGGGSGGNSLVHNLNADIREEIVERVACLLYHVNFSLNFFLYTFNTAQFRENIVLMLKSFWRLPCSSKKRGIRHTTTPNHSCQSVKHLTVKTQII